MSSGVNGARRTLALLKPSTSHSPICRSCQATLHRRGYATAAAAESQTDSPQDLKTQTPPAPEAKHTIKAGVVLSRPPRITRDLTPFEKSFYFYQKRLNERLSLPFTRYFYFNRGTPGDVQWKKTIGERETPSRDIGRYNAYSQDAWNDELLVGAKESEPDQMIDALVRDAEGYLQSDTVDGAGEKEELPKPLSRVTEADEKGDQKSLDRLQQRTLYLLVQGKGGHWQFPSVGVQIRKDTLVTAAERALIESAGPNMNHWMVGHHPIGHLNTNYKEPQEDPDAKTKILGEKTFFMKGRIMAGQAKLEGNVQDIKDFKWLSKDEIQTHVTPRYWSSVKNMMSER